MERSKFRWALIKLILFGIFLVNLGLVQLWHHIIEREEHNPLSKLSKQELGRRRAIVETAASRRFEEVRKFVKKGGIYSPYDYFNDLFEFEKTFDDLGMRGPTSPYENFFCSFALQNVGEGRVYSQKDFDKASKEFQERCAKSGFERYVLIPKKRMEINWLGVLWWFLTMYLKNLPLAFILFLVWLIEGSYEWILIPRLFRFVFLLATYPLTIWRVVKINAFEFMSEADVRRRKADIFSPLSQEETNHLKEAIRSGLTFSQLRRKIADAYPDPQHSLAFALTVTLVFTLTLKSAEAGTKDKGILLESCITLEQTLSPQHLPRMGIGDNAEIQPEKTGWPGAYVGEELAIDVSEIAPPLSFVLLSQEVTCTAMQEFLRKIFHVPLQAVQFEAKLALQSQI